MFHSYQAKEVSCSGNVRSFKRWDWILDCKSRSPQPVARTQRHSQTACPARRQSHDISLLLTQKYTVDGNLACTPQSRNGDRLSSNSSTSKRTFNLLPDSVLFNSIKSCTTLFDCQQLLSRNAAQLDAMLLSTLVTQTVLVAVDVPLQEQQDLEHQKQQQKAVNKSATVIQSPLLPASSAAAAECASSTPPDTAASTVGSTSGGGSSSTSRTVAAARQGAPKTRSVMQSSRTAGQTFSRYLRQLADTALQLCGSFRPQQFANVVYGLAKCGYKAPPDWISKYLAKAELQLVQFSPRNLALLIWALGTMKVGIPRQFCASFLAECSDKLSAFNPIDLANTLWGLAILAVQPPRDWLATALSACEQQWARFKPQELSIAIWGLAKLGMEFSLRAQPGHQHYGVAGGLDDAGIQGLLGVVTQQMPVMTPQQASNIVWGLAVGRTLLAPQQVQVLADQSLLVLRQSASSCCSQALATITWSLTKLHWTPSYQQAQLLLSILVQHQQQHALSARQAALLLWSCSKLRLRLAVPAMQQLMVQIVNVLPTAAPVDVVQVLAGCKTLGWRPAKVWWLRFYARSPVLLEQATAGELAQLLAAAAAVAPLRPSKPWWLCFWQQVGAAADATFEIRHLQRKGQLVIAAPMSTRKLESGSSNSKGLVLSPSGGRRAHSSKSSSGSSSISSSSSSSSKSKVQNRQPAKSTAAEQELLQLNPYAVLQQYMQQYILLRAAAKPLPHDPQMQQLLVRPYSALLLLWAAAKLQLLVPKKLLWQLLLLVVVDVPSYTPVQLGTIMQTIGVLIATHGHDKVQCHAVLKHLTVAAQWRLHCGAAGEGAVRSRYVRALRFMAYEANTVRLLVPKWQAQSA